MAELSPRPDAPAVMRRLPDRGAGPRRCRASDTPRTPGRSHLSGCSGLSRRPTSRVQRSRRYRVDPELRPDGVGRAGARTPSRRSCRGRPRTASAQCGPPPRPGPARGGRAPRPGSLQGPVHRLRRASRQARATAGPHARLGARRRPRPRSSSKPSPRSSRGSKPGVSRGPRRRGRRSRESETSPTTRQIPAAVKRAVYERDGGRCRYEDEQGRRCTARQGLEFHHRHPFGRGGDHSLANVSLACRLCRARHNRHYAESRIMPSRRIRAARGAVVSEAQSA